MKVVAPLEREKKPIIINDIGSTCSNIYIYIYNKQQLWGGCYHDNSNIVKTY